MGKKDIYIVQRPFIANGRQIFRRGTRLMGDNPVIKGNEHLMVLSTEGFDVEDASARPGERRNVTPAKEPTKAELLEEAKSKGVEVKSTATKAEIAEALEEA